MAKGAEDLLEEGAYRAELHTSACGGPIWEVMERQGGGYRLTMYGNVDVSALKRLLDRIEERDEFQPVLALDERGGE